MFGCWKTNGAEWNKNVIPLFWVFHDKIKQLSFGPNQRVQKNKGKNKGKK